MRDHVRLSPTHGAWHPSAWGGAMKITWWAVWLAVVLAAAWAVFVLYVLPWLVGLGECRLPGIR